MCCHGYAGHAVDAYPNLEGDGAWHYISVILVKKAHFHRNTVINVLTDICFNNVFLVVMSDEYRVFEYHFNIRIVKKKSLFFGINIVKFS